MAYLDIITTYNLGWMAMNLGKNIHAIHIQLLLNQMSPYIFIEYPKTQ